MINKTKLYEKKHGILKYFFWRHFLILMLYMVSGQEAKPKPPEAKMPKQNFISGIVLERQNWSSGPNKKEDT